MKVKSEREVAQSCQTLRNPMDCGLPGSSVHGIFQARVLEWGAIAFSDPSPHYSPTHKPGKEGRWVSQFRDMVFKLVALLVTAELGYESRPA